MRIKENIIRRSVPYELAANRARSNKQGVYISMSLGRGQEETEKNQLKPTSYFCFTE